MLQKLLISAVFLFIGSVGQYGFCQGIATLNGEWHVTKGMMNGEEVPTDVLASMTLNVKNSGKFTAKSGGLTSKGEFSEGQSLDQLIVKIDGGADLGRNLKAKWKMESGSLTIAFSQDGFPSAFDSSKGNKLLVLSYKAGARPIAAVTAATAPTSAAPATGGRPGGRGASYPR